MVLVNDCNHIVHFKESGVARFSLINKTSRYFTWVKPENKSLALIYNSNWLESDVFINPQGEKVVDYMKMRVIYWRTFLYGRQRILIVTDSQETATRLSNEQTTTPLTLKISANIHELGVNLVSEKLGDLLYLSLESQKSQLFHSLPAIDFQFVSGLNHQKMGLKIQNLQLDCQIDNMVYTTLIAKKQVVESNMNQQSNIKKILTSKNSQIRKSIHILV